MCQLPGDIYIEECYRPTEKQTTKIDHHDYEYDYDNNGNKSVIGPLYYQALATYLLTLGQKIIRVLPYLQFLYLKRIESHKYKI